MQINEVPVSKAAVIVLGSKVPAVKMVSSAAKIFNKPTPVNPTRRFSRFLQGEDFGPADITVGMMWYDVCMCVGVYCVRV